MKPLRTLHRRSLPFLFLLPLLLATCVDGPSAPEGSGGSTGFVIAPVFSLVGPQGPALSEGQEDALSEAFDRVDRFRMQVRRVSDNTLVLDTTISVTPGADQYDLTVPISATNNEQFLLTLIALAGDTELFKAENIPATATPAGAAPGSPPPAAVQIPLVYSGPGATATSVTVGTGQVVLAPGGSATVGSSVLDAGGAVIAGVPVAWTTSAAGVATVSGGQVSAVGEGLTTVTATTPTGLASSATVYVVGGELAYVEGGTLKVRGPAAGTPTERGAGASEPAWSTDGARLFYVSGGVVHRSGGGALTEGSWPSVSPDGTKLAVERGGQIFFANDDGTAPTPGPSGTAPVWSDGETVVVGGGSIERVRADGSGRTTVVAGEAALPALAGDGRVAWIEGGALRATGAAGALVSGASGRPTWSPNGMWLVVGSGSGLMLVPSDGSAPGVALPGLGAASHPAFKPTGSVQPAAAVSVSGFNPDPPVPGQPLHVLGGGFDWIIPANNQVIWPTRDGSTPSEILAVSQGAIATVMPRNVVAGQVRVETRASSGLLLFEPTFGALDVTARAPWGTAVEGVDLSLAGSTGSTSASTGASGLVQFSNLLPGGYTLTITPPAGWSLTGDAVRSLTIGAETTDLALELTPSIQSVTLSPDPRALAVGSTLGVSLVVSGPGGLSIPQVQGLAWRSASAELTVTSGAGLNAALGGVFAGEGPGTSVLEVDVAGTTYTFPVTVTSSIQGTVTLDGGAPAPGVSVQAMRGGLLVADALTGPDGRYTLSGLFRGTHDVAPAAAADLLPVPEGQTVVLDDANPTGTADFTMQSFAGLDVTSRTPWGTPAGGVTVKVVDASSVEVAAGVTDGEGNLRLQRIRAGTYTIIISPPGGFQLQGAANRSLDLSGTVVLALVLDPFVSQVQIQPAEPTIPVGSAINVTATALDYNGHIIPQFHSTTWFARTGHVAAAGVGLQGQVGGIAPSELRGAVFALELNGQIFDFSATVTSFISGNVTISTADGSEPSVGTGIILEKDGAKVAETSTLAGGSYRFDGLLAGTYTVKPVVPAGMSVSPASATVELGGGSATGTANFVISQAIPGGADRPNVMLCGGSSRDVRSFFPAGSSLTLVSGCAPDANTQALVISRNWGKGISASALQAYVIAGGIVLTEWSTTADIWSAVFGTATYLGGWNGACYDIIPAIVQFSPGDPFWQANPWQPINPSYSGCGHSISHYPGLTPLMGWSASAVAVGYRDLGAGRVWASDFDWQDLDSQYYGLSYAYTEQLMGYMMTHRASAYVPFEASAASVGPAIQLLPQVPPSSDAFRPQSMDTSPGAAERRTRSLEGRR